jgi:hypothetical protein
MVRVLNPSRRTVDVYFNTLREPPQLLGTVNANSASRFAIPVTEAQWVFLSVRAEPNGAILDATRVRLDPARDVEFRVDLDRRH